ncbi:Activating signal cointegrator 1 [Clonorchis sinensis]|uniref:Activating signal cointegrator 1 n=1 Tax=Clonorchis sinensis TaxID=79923 RepID=A0A8T1MFD2_CLOSI|nr:Activating signal cointegrator 1 [Clonorchis sinensis]
MTLNRNGESGHLGRAPICVQKLLESSPYTFTRRETMDHVRLILKNALGEKAASDFINSALAVENVQDIKKRVCTLLDTRKAENRKVYEVLMREKERRAAFPEEGYRKINTGPNAPCDLTVSTVREKVPPKEDEDRVKIDSSGPRKKQKPKFYPLFTEGARGDHLVSLLPGRHPCQCLATKHQLVSNCTNCGRIVCAQEGSGPCFFCGNLVCSKEERDKIALGTKQAVKLKNRLLHAPWAPGTQTPPYRRKSCAKRANAVDVPGSYDDENSQEEDEDWDLIQVQTVKEDAQQRLEEGLAAALANRDRLLEYDVTTARRTRVLDDEMDYFVSEGSGGAAAWLSPEARERVAKRLAELRALRHASRLQGTHLCIDFAGRSVEIVDTRDEAARQLYQPNQEEIDQLEESLRDKESNDLNKGSASSQVIAGRMIDPTLNDQFLQFLPTLTRSQLSVDQAPESSSLMKALRDAPNGLRVQDDISRQLTDEGYCLSMHQPWASFLVRGLKKRLF